MRERYAYNLNGQRASAWIANGSLQTANYYADGAPVAYYSATDGASITCTRRDSPRIAVRSNVGGGRESRPGRSGELAGIRTQDPRLKRALLYQLSYELVQGR